MAIGSIDLVGPDVPSSSTELEHSQSPVWTSAIDRSTCPDIHRAGDAVILACAGLDRLGLGDQIEERISPDAMLPAVAQGALAIQARSGEALCDDLAAIDHAQTACDVAAERGFLARLGADCTVPVACLAQRREDGMLWLRGLVAAEDGSRIVRGDLEVAAGEAVSGGARLAERILASGGEDILAKIRSEVGS